MRENPLEELGTKVGRKEARKVKAREEKDRGLWFGLGMFGLVGWSVAIPTLVGVAIGAAIDRAWPGRISWTLTLLFLGAALGCWNAWYWSNGRVAARSNDYAVLTPTRR